MNSFFLCIHWGYCTYQTTVTHTTNLLQQPSSRKHTEDGEGIQCAFKFVVYHDFVKLRYIEITKLIERGQTLP